MRSFYRTLTAGLVLAVFAPMSNLWAITPEDRLSIESECHEEAETYGIPQEQLSDYVDGCMMSRGALVPSFPQTDTSEFAPGEEATMEEPPVEEPGQPELLPEQGSEIQ